MGNPFTLFKALTFLLLTFVATTAKDLAPALRGESIPKQEEQETTKNHPRRKLFIQNIFDLISSVETCRELSPGVYQTFNELYIIGIYRVYFDGHKVGSCSSIVNYATTCGSVTCGSPSICIFANKTCAPPPSCMTQCTSSFKKGAFESISNPTPIASSAYTAFPSSKQLKAFGTSMTGFSVLNGEGGNPTLKLFRNPTDPAPAVVWTLLEQLPVSTSGFIYTQYDGTDLFTISWEGWKTPANPQDLINSQITIRFSTGDYLICYGAGKLSNGCPASAGVERAFLSFAANQTTASLCFPTESPFNRVDKTCAQNAAPGNGKSWNWPENNCFCGNLK